MTFDPDVQPVRRTTFNIQLHAPFSDACRGESSNWRYAEMKWLKTIDGIVENYSIDEEEATTIVSCEGKLICRDLARARFLDNMGNTPGPVFSLACSLFDRYGCLRSEFMEHPIKKGSGAWGAELDEDDIFLIERLVMAEPHRDLDLVADLLSQMMSVIGTQTVRFVAVACPRTTSDAGTYDEMDNVEICTIDAVDDISTTHFWRSLGFRRIGSSDWFGFNPHPRHQSRRLEANKDFDLPIQQNCAAKHEVQGLLEDSWTLEDTVYLSRLQQIFGEATADDQQWQCMDNQGNSLLHIAAAKLMTESIRWILKRTKQLNDKPNKEGETPYEFLLSLCDKARTTHDLTVIGDHSDYFTGFSDQAVSCMVLLRQLVNANDIDIVHLRFGCTCGICTLGFLSPRMKFALESAANAWYDDRHSSVDNLCCFLLEETDLWFVPRQLRIGLNTRTSLKEAFPIIVRCFAMCLKDGVIPTKENIEGVADKGEWETVCNGFFRLGGTVSSVTSMIFKQAMESDEFAGNSSHFDAHKDRISKLRRCRNDHEFGFVSGLCGYAHELSSPV
jgi:hypothetical protein